MRQHSFEASLWRWREGSWFFVTLPHDVTDEIDDLVSGTTSGFGAVKVEVQVGTTRWSTSLFPSKEEGAYVLPVKKAVRTAEGLGDGDPADVTITLVDR